MKIPDAANLSHALGVLADYYLLAGLLLAAAWLAQRWMRQPAARLAVNWMVAVELLVLAVVCAVPVWPRISLLRAASAPVSPERPVVLAPPAAAPPQSAGDHAPSRPLVPPALNSPRNLELRTGSVPALPESPIAVPHESPTPRDVVAPRSSWIEWIALACFGCMTMVLCWLAWGAVVAWRACRLAKPAPPWLAAEMARIVGEGRRAPRVLVGTRTRTAAALGLFRPTILLPVELAGDAATPALRSVLRHEWAHIESGDLWLLALGRCLLVPLFAHPLFWWLRRAVRRDQELLADAAAAGDNRPAYAEELLQLARRAIGPLPLSASVGIWENSSQLSKRIAMLLNENMRIEPRTSRRWRVQAAGLLTLLAAGVSFLTLQPGRSAGGEPKTQTVAKQPGGEKAKPDSNEAVRAGESLLGKGDLDGAIAEFTKAIRRDPQNAHGYYGRACVYKRKHDEAKAGADLRQVLSLDPKLAGTYLSHGWAYGRDREIDRAIAYLSRFAPFKREDIGAAAIRGYCYWLKGDCKKAVADFSEAIRLFPRDDRDLGYRGQCYVEMDEPDKAIADYSEALALVQEGDKAGVRAQRSLAYAEKRDFDNAASDIKVAITIHPDSCHYTRGMIDWIKGDRKAATVEFEKAVKLDAAKSQDDAVQWFQSYVADMEAHMDPIQPPGYWQLQRPEFRKQIRISPEQEKKLRAISAAISEQQAKYGRDIGERLAKLPPQKVREAAADMWRGFWPKQRESARKQVDEVLTAEQRLALKRESLRPAALELQFDPNVFKSVPLTQAQRDKIARISEDAQKKLRELAARQSERNEAFLRGLKGERREKALALVEARYRDDPLHVDDVDAALLDDQAVGLIMAASGPNSGSPVLVETSNPAGMTMYMTTTSIDAPAPPSSTTFAGSISVVGNIAVNPSSAALARLPFFGEVLSQSSDLNKEWSITAAQAKQLAEITTNFQKGQERIVATIKGLASEDRKKRRLEFLGDDKKLKAEAVQRTEKVLTPKQIAAVKEQLLRRYVYYMMRDSAAMRAIGIEEKEAATTAAAENDYDSINKPVFEAGGKILDVLTPQQIEGLFDEYEKRMGGQV
jgi:tetratricopeptide (TPR) repeat protein